MSSTTTPTIESLAAEANKLLTRKTRPGEKESIVIPVDDAPEWFTDLCHEAHGDMMPDDWRYEFIEDALTQLENGDENARDVDAYPYTADRLNWLSSRLDRMAYCNEAAEDWGGFSEIENFISAGMNKEMQEVYDLVKQQLESRLEELENAEQEAIDASNDADDMQEERE